MSATHEAVAGAEPNQGHLAVTELVRRGTVSAVITQNLDGLHQASGVPTDRVIELHGNTTHAHCLNCGQEYDLDPIREACLADAALPGVRGLRRRGQDRDRVLRPGHARGRDAAGREGRSPWPATCSWPSGRR